MAKKKPETITKSKHGNLKFTIEIFEAICKDISTSSKGLVSICKNYNIAAVTFYEWIYNDVELANKYARARELQAEILADEIIDIADFTKNDDLMTEFGEIPNHEWINRSKLRVDARKWKASKLAPKKYGDKLDVTSAGNELKQTVVINTTPDIAKNIEGL